MAKLDKLQDKLLPVMTVILIGAAFLVGMMWGKLQVYEKGGVKTGVPSGNQQAAQGDSPLSVASLKAMAKELKLNEKEFDACLDEGKYEEKVNADESYGQEVGVRGTPAFFVNDLFFSGALPQDIFESIVDHVLAGGNWSNPPEKLVALFDGNVQNGEATVKENGVNYGVGYKIVEFSDFECPFCARAFLTMTGLLGKYGDKISLEYRHFPLSIHSNAQKAAEASECAGDQGKFWEMHDEIFGTFAT